MVSIKLGEAGCAGAREFDAQASEFDIQASEFDAQDTVG